MEEQWIHQHDLNAGHEDHREDAGLIVEAQQEYRRNDGEARQEIAHDHRAQKVAVFFFENQSADRALPIHHVDAAKD